MAYQPVVKSARVSIQTLVFPSDTLIRDVLFAFGAPIYFNDLEKSSRLVEIEEMWEASIGELHADACDLISTVDGKLEQVGGMLSEFMPASSNTLTYHFEKWSGEAIVTQYSY